MMKNYCIREDYISRTVAETFVDDPADFWTESRIAASGYYQYYVYKKAAEIAAGTARCSFADIGCGYPMKAQEIILPVTGNVTLVDQPSMKSLMEERFPELDFVPLDLEKTESALPKRFDCVVCSDVIEHLLDPDPLMNFIRRILAPGGVVVLSTPERDIVRGPGCLSSPKAEHVREWNQAELAEYLELCGFDVEEHLLMPQGRLNRLEELTLPLIRGLNRRRYSGCQAAVCRPR